MSWEIVVGLEVHVQLNTNTKAFCNDRNVFGDSANTHISPITLAHPGTLPRINKNHFRSAIKIGLAFNSVINKTSFFDRKNYFYPDLPKGYQITQDERPICIGGTFSYIMGNGIINEMRIHHVHMEEDAGKSIHDIDPGNTYLDYNRAGVPLLEIVTEPDLRSSEEVYHFIASLQQLVRHLGISDGNMEEGSFRCDCNVSVKKVSDPNLGERCEIKNLNSKRYAKVAIEYEAKRQIKILEAGGVIYKTTMLFNPNTGKTYPMRDKEDVNDYRYFNDPDLPQVVIDDSLLLELKAEVSKIPLEQYKELREKYSLTHDNAMVIIDESAYVNLFLQLASSGYDPKEAALLITNKIAPFVDKYPLEMVSSNNFLIKIKQFLDLVVSDKVSKSSAYNQLFDKMWNEAGIELIELAGKLEILQESDQSFIKEIVGNVIKQFPQKVDEYNKGKKGLIGFFMGQAMRQAKGKADPKLLQSEIEKALIR